MVWEGSNLLGRPKALGSVDCQMLRAGGLEVGRPSLRSAFSADDLSVVPQTEQRIAYRIPEAARLIGVSKSKMWAMIADKTIEARKIKGTTLITHAALQALVDGAPLSQTK